MDSPDRVVPEAPVVPAPRVRPPVGTAAAAAGALAVLARVPAARERFLAVPGWDPVAPVRAPVPPAARASPA